LKIDTQPTEDHQVKLRVELEPEQLETAKRRAARQIARKAKIPGFRPGKAPYHIIERFAGEAAITEDALDLLVKEVYPKALEEGDIRPFGPGILENIASTDPPVFEFIVPLEAEVELGDYKSLRLPYEPKEVSAEEIEQVLENIRQQQALQQPVDRPAQDGDQLQIKLNAEYKQVEGGEEKTFIRDRSVPVIIGGEDSDAADEWPFPGFSRQLTGLSAGEEKTFSHTFAEDTQNEALRGKEVEYTVVVENIKERLLPDLDDALAQSLGEYEDLEALREDVRKRLEERDLEQYDQDYEEKLFEELWKVSTLKYPPQLVEREMEEMLHQLQHRLEQQGMDMDLYLKIRQQDMEALREELKPVAESRAKKYLVIFEVARQEQVEVDPNEVKAETLNTLNMAAQKMSREDIRKMTSQETVSRLASDVTYDLLVRKATEKLMSIFKGEAQESEVPEGQAEAQGLVSEPELEEAPETAASEAETSPAMQEGTAVSESETEQAPENHPSTEQGQQSEPTDLDPHTDDQPETPDTSQAPGSDPDA
jgi:trigger factor